MKKDILQSINKYKAMAKIDIVSVTKKRPTKMLLNELRCVDSIKNLKDINPQSVSCVVVLGYDVPGDGGGGHFFWDVTPVSKGDEYYGDFILPNRPSGPGSWRRLNDGPISVRWFGAKGDGTSDDTPAIQEAIRYAQKVAIKYAQKPKEKDFDPQEYYPIRACFPKEVYFPRGTYLVSQPINVGSCRIRGEFVTWYPAGNMGLNSTVIKAGPTFKTDGKNAVLFSETAPCQIIDLIVEANQQCQYAVYLEKAVMPLTLVSNIFALNAKEYGFYFKKCQGATVERLWARGNNIGIVAEDCNASRFDNCRVDLNKSHGMFVKSMEYSAGCRIENLVSETNCGCGLLTQGVAREITHLRASNCWIEENMYDGIKLENCQYAVIEGARVSNHNTFTKWKHIVKDMEKEEKKSKKTNPSLVYYKHFLKTLQNKILNKETKNNDRCIRLVSSKRCKVFNCFADSIENKEYRQICDEGGEQNDICENNWPQPLGCLKMAAISIP